MESLHCLVSELTWLPRGHRTVCTEPELLKTIVKLLFLNLLNSKTRRVVTFFCESNLQISVFHFQVVWSWALGRLPSVSLIS